MKFYRNKLDRDQEILIIVVLSLIFILLLGNIYQEVSSWKNETEKNLEDEKVLFLKIKKIIESSPMTSSEGLTPENFGSKISKIARNNGVVIDRVQPIKNRILSITIKQVDFPDLLNLMRDIKSLGFVSISNASLRRNISGGTYAGIRAQIVLSI